MLLTMVVSQPSLLLTGALQALEMADNIKTPIQISKKIKSLLLK